MADQYTTSQSGKRDSTSFVPWSSSFSPTSEHNDGYKRFDRDTVEAREHQQELENRQQQAHNELPYKKPEIAVIELQQENFARTDYPQYPPLTKPSGWPIFWGEWWLETVACFVVMGALGAVVGLVWAYNNQPLPNWKHGITINALISVFLVIMKSGMGLVLAQGLAHLKWTWFDNARPLQDLETYDKAAHGPLGAAMLLLTVRNRHIITAIGAIVTIAALAIDPTVQAMVKYYDCAWPIASETATMPRAQVYSEQGLHASAGTASVTLGMQAAINSGLFTPGGIAMDFSCPSGNCTFPTMYSSIAYCSECVDISDRIKIQNLVGRVNYTDYVDPDTGLSYYEYNYTETSLPSGLKAIDSNELDATYFVTASPNVDGVIDLLVGTSPFNGSATGCESAKEKESWPCRGYGAASCAMIPCVRTFTGKVAGGSLIETPVAKFTEWSSTENVSPYSAMVDMSCVEDPSKRKKLAQLGYKFENSTTFIPYHHSFDEITGDWEPDGYNDNGDPTIQNLSINSLVPRKCIYELNLEAINSLNQFWSTYFNGSLVPLGTLYTGPSQLEAIYNEGQVSFASVAEIFHNLSMSMTTHIRQNGVQPYSPPTHGQVLHNITCVRVRWEFLIFPAVIVVMMVTFFVGMALDTRNRSGVQGIDHSFKSSPLALMVHGLDTRMQEKLTSPIEVMRGEKSAVGSGRSEAQKVMVRLSPTENGLRFVAE